MSKNNLESRSNVVNLQFAETEDLLCDCNA